MKKNNKIVAGVFKLEYEFDNLKCKNVDLVPLTGFITYREDERGNSCYYDSRYILTRLYRVNAPAYEA